MKDQRLLFFGAGGAAYGIGNLTVSAMINEGVSKEEADSRIFMIDINGLLTTNRTDIKPEMRKFAKNMKPMKDLLEIINEVKPTILIGASTIGGSFKTEHIKAMAKLNERPIIFALSNPTEKAECTAEAAYVHTEGRCVYSSGSPFAPVHYNGMVFKPGQGNNAYIFPGVGLGVICSGIHHIEDEVFLIAAREVASMVTEESLAEGSLFPPLRLIKECSLQIATTILRYAYKKGAFRLSRYRSFDYNILFQVSRPCIPSRTITERSSRITCTIITTKARFRNRGPGPKFHTFTQNPWIPYRNTVIINIFFIFLLFFTAPSFYF